jgi:hypothetical protein
VDHAQSLIHVEDNFTNDMPNTSIAALDFRRLLCTARDGSDREDEGRDSEGEE